MDLKNQEKDIIKSQIMGDISTCLGRTKIDEAMLMFIHIYNELMSALDMSEDTDSIKLITSTHNDFIKLLKDVEFRKKTEMFYITKGSEANSFLFDDSVKDTKIYVLDNSQYGQINELFLKLYQVTGLIKEKLMGDSKGVTLEGFDAK